MKDYTSIDAENFATLLKILQSCFTKEKNKDIVLKKMMELLHKIQDTPPEAGTSFCTLTEDIINKKAKKERSKARIKLFETFEESSEEEDTTMVDLSLDQLSTESDTKTEQDELQHTNKTE